jgi:hypothetical protein
MKHHQPHDETALEIAAGIMSLLIIGLALIFIGLS